MIKFSLQPNSLFWVGKKGFSSVVQFYVGMIVTFLLKIKQTDPEGRGKKKRTVKMREMQLFINSLRIRGSSSVKDRCFGLADKLGQLLL